MITTCSDKWSPRTGLHNALTKSAKTEPSETMENLVYTRGIMLRVRYKFPDALQAIPDALTEARRTCPRELIHKPA